MVVCNRSYLLSIIDFVIVLYHLIDGILSNVCMMSEYWITEAENKRGWYEKSITKQIIKKKLVSLPATSSART